MLLTSVQYITFRVGAVRNRARTIRGRGASIKTLLFIELSCTSRASCGFTSQHKAAGLTIQSFRLITVSHCKQALKIKTCNALISENNNMNH